ncbi:MAG: hypothetical protein JXQ27_18815 [Acidobacteria bacterium]|nr:hypothetical protein [Acidobacteriota bacterium]
MGKGSSRGEMTLYIGPNVTESLSSMQWKLVDPDGHELRGTYHERADSPGKGIFHFTPTNFSEYLTAKSLFYSEGSTVENITVGYPAGNTYPKTKQTNKGLSFTMNCTLKADFQATIDGVPVDSQVTLKIAASGLRPAEGDQEEQVVHWTIPTKETYSLKKVGSFREEGTLELYLGPDQGEDLADGEFRVYTDLGTTIEGTYSQSGKKVSLAGFEDEMLPMLTEFVEQALQGMQFAGEIGTFSDVQVAITKLTSTATVKAGVSIKLQLKVNYNASAIVDGVTENSKGSLQITGTGLPAS